MTATNLATARRDTDLTRNALTALFISYIAPEDQRGKDRNYNTVGFTFLEDLIRALPAGGQRSFRDTLSALESFLDKGGFICPPNNAPSYENILTIQTDSQGLVNIIYMPALFSYQGKLCVRLGDNLAVVNQKEDKLTLGNLKCKIISEKVKTASGGYYKFFLKAFDAEESFLIEARTPRPDSIQGLTDQNRVVLLTDETVTSGAERIIKRYDPDGNVESDLDVGLPIWPYFSEVRGITRTEFKSLRDLELADYGIVKVATASENSFAKYNLYLETGVTVSTNTALNAVIDSFVQRGWTMGDITSYFADNNMTLQIRDKVWRDNNTKCNVDAVIIPIAPPQRNLPPNHSAAASGAVDVTAVAEKSEAPALKSAEVSEPMPDMTAASVDEEAPVPAASATAPAPAKAQPPVEAVEEPACPMPEPTPAPAKPVTETPTPAEPKVETPMIMMGDDPEFNDDDIPF